MSELLRATALRRTFKLPRATVTGPGRVRHAVDGVDLDLAEGASLGIVGESGSGKTTLVRILLGLDPHAEGTVLFRGREVHAGRAARLRWYRREAQLVLQDPLSSLDPRMKIESIIREPLVCLKADEHRDSKYNRRIDEVLEAVGLPPDSRRRYPHEFSGGQQQRIAIARAIAPRPSLLVGDEPVSALDVSVRIQILDLLRSLRDDLGLALILISHDLGVVRYLCDDVMVLRAGQVVEHGRSEDLLHNPTHEYTRALLDAVPRLPAV